MRKNASRFARALVASSALTLFASCASDPVGRGMEYCLDNAQTALDASRGLEGRLAPAGNLATIAKWKDGTGLNGIRATLVADKAARAENKYWLCLESDRLPGLRLYAPAPADAANAGRFDADFSSAKFFCNYDDGWSEFDLPLSGRVTVERTGDALALKSESGIERLPAHLGRLRAGSKVMSGDRALDALRYRQERIVALADFMHGKNLTADIPPWKGFKSAWQAFLFPETVSEKKRDAAWKSLAANYPGGEKAFAKSAFARAEEYSWSKEYTDAVFPENMRELRQTGALWRDWTEAGTWIYAEYNWPSFNRALADGVTVAGNAK